MTLMRTNTLTKSDFLGKRTYILADGTEAPSDTFRIRLLKAGDRTVEDVIGSVSPVNGILLLGQSFLGRFRSWSIDNTKHVLVLE
jgi:predicted aspartyl protease